MSQSYAVKGIVKSSAFRNVCYLIALLALVAMLGSLYYFFVRTTTGRYMDQMAFHQAELIQPFFIKGSEGFLDSLPFLSLIIAIIFGVTTLVKHPNWQQLSRILLVALSMGAANFSTRLLKVYVFDRPDVGLENWFRNSLPSGHTTLAASSAAAIFLMVSPKWRPLISFLGGSYAIFAGIATFLNQWHRPADVIAAFLVVTAWALVCTWLMTKYPRIFTPRQEKTHGTFMKNSLAWVILSFILAFVPLLTTLVEPLPTITSAEVDDLLYARPQSTNFFWYGISFITLSGYSIVAGSLLWFSCFVPESYYPSKPASPKKTRY